MSKPRLRKVKRKYIKKIKVDNKLQNKSNIPSSQEAIPVSIPLTEKEAKAMSQLIANSYSVYMKELQKASSIEDTNNLKHLNSILTEYVSPYMLIGFLPNNDPIEIFYTPTPKDKEALMERLRRTFVRMVNGSND